MVMMARTSKPATTARDAALRLLARREHSRWELTQKLEQRGFSSEDYAPVLDAMQHEGLLSDTRFAAALLRQRSGQGYGERRVQQELEHHRIAPEDQRQAWAEVESDTLPDWVTQAYAVLCRRHAPGEPLTLQQRAATQRFLLRRGFAPETVQAAWRRWGQ